jgi:hypothetical protein
MKFKDISMKTNITNALLFLLLLSTSYVVQAAEADNGSVLSDNIRRAIITNSIENREPVTDLTNGIVTSDINKVYLFTEVIGKAKTMVTHRWFLDGKLEAEVVLKVGSNRWRTYSSKTLKTPQHYGNWQVEVLDENNQQIASVTFQYGG